MKIPCVDAPTPKVPNLKLKKKKVIFILCFYSLLLGAGVVLVCDHHACEHVLFAIILILWGSRNKKFVGIQSIKYKTLEIFLYLVVCVVFLGEGC